MNIAVKCTAHSKLKFRLRSQEAQDVSVAWLQNSSVVLVLEVSVCILWRCVDHCEWWTCAWLLSLIVIVLTLLCTTEPPGTKFTVRSNTSQPIVNFSLLLFTILPADAKMLQTSLIYSTSTYRILGLVFFCFIFAVIGLVYTVVCVYGVFLKLPARRGTSTRWDSMYCIVTYLPWYFRLTLWLSHDSAIVTSLQIPAVIYWPVCPLTALLCSFPHCLFPKVLHGVNMAFRTLAICILSLRTLLYSLPLACHLVDYVSWFFFSTLNYWHFIFIGCKSWLKWLYLMVVVLLWGYSQPDI